MSTAKKRKYAKRVRNQPSNVSLDQSDDPPGGRGSFQSPRDSTPGSSGQQQRGFHQARFPSRGGRGRGPSNELSLPLTYATDSTPGSSGQQQRGFHQARFPSRGGRGRGQSNEIPLDLTYVNSNETDDSDHAASPESASESAPSFLGNETDDSDHAASPESASESAPSFLDPNIIYEKLTPEEKLEMGLPLRSPKKSAEFMHRFIKRCVFSKKLGDPEEYLKKNKLILKDDKAKKKRKARKAPKAKGLSAKKRRELRLAQPDPDKQRYDAYLPMHELWKQYIRDLCDGLGPDTDTDMIQEKMLRAELHGAIITVFKSKCPSYVGHTGIMIQETKYMFKIINKEDKIKVLPKKGSVFSVETDGFTTYLYGNNLLMTPGERDVKKFKTGGSLEL